jgi:hypothetical protein
VGSREALTKVAKALGRDPFHLFVEATPSQVAMVTADSGKGYRECLCFLFGVTPGVARDALRALQMDQAA